MKNMFWLMVLVAALSAGCSNNHDTPPEVRRTNITASSLTINNSQPGGALPDLGVEISGADYTIYEFEEGDMIRVVSEHGVNTILTASNSGLEGITFVGDFTPVASIDTYYAVYPHTFRIDHRGRLEVDLRQQDGTAKNAALLAAVAKNVEGDKVHFNFRPVNALLQVGIKDTPTVYDEVIIKTYEGVHSEFYVHMDDDMRIETKMWSIEPHLKIYLAEDEDDSFFLSLLPNNTFNDFKMEVTSTTGKKYDKELNKIRFEQGFSYTTTMRVDYNPQIKVYDIKTSSHSIDYTINIYDIMYDDVRCFITDDLQREYTQEEVYSMGTPLQTNTSGLIDKTKYYCSFTDLDPETEYRMYFAAYDGSEYLAFEKIEATTTELQPMVTCGVNTSYDYYTSGYSSIANKMVNVSFVLGENFEYGIDGKSRSVSRYYDIEEDQIESAGITLRNHVTSKEQTYTLNFKDGVIGANQEYNLGYKDIDWAEYSATAFVVLKDGTRVESEPTTHYVTGFPYDSEKGEFHGFYTEDDWDLNNTYSALRFPWEDISNGVSDLLNSFIFFKEHDGLAMEGGLRWAQVLSPRFFIPSDDLYIKAYWDISSRWTARDACLALLRSTENGGDADDEIFAYDPGDSDHYTMTSEAFKMDPNYPCFQIELQVAFRGPFGHVHHLVLEYN